MKRAIADAFRWVAFPAGGAGACVGAVPGRSTVVMSEQPYGSGRATFDITL